MWSANKSYALIALHCIENWIQNIFILMPLSLTLSRMLKLPLLRDGMFSRLCSVILIDCLTS